MDHVLLKPNEERWKYSNRITVAVQLPNEVYSFVEDGAITRSYIKYYDDMAFVLIAEPRGEDVIVKTWYKWDGDKMRMNEVRKGMLLHLKKTKI